MNTNIASAWSIGSKTEAKAEIGETHVCIELADEAGEVVVLEIGRQKKASELRRIPDDEAGVGWAPGNDVVGGGIVHHVVCLQKKRRRSSCSGGGGVGLWPTVHLGLEWVFLELTQERDMYIYNIMSRREGQRKKTQNLQERYREEGLFDFNAVCTIGYWRLLELITAPWKIWKFLFYFLSFYF